MQARSSVGSITVNGELVSIARVSLPGLPEAVRTVAIAELVGLDLRFATALQPGYLRLIYNGSSAGVAGKLRLYDPDTVMFNLDHQEGMIEVHDTLMSRITGKPFVTARGPEPARSDALTLPALVGAIIGLAFLAWWVFA